MATVGIEPIEGFLNNKTEVLRPLHRFVESQAGAETVLRSGMFLSLAYPGLQRISGVFGMEPYPDPVPVRITPEPGKNGRVIPTLPWQVYASNAFLMPLCCRKNAGCTIYTKDML